MTSAAAVSCRPRKERKATTVLRNFSVDGSGFNRSLGRLIETSAARHARPAKNRKARRQPKRSAICAAMGTPRMGAAK